MKNNPLAHRAYSPICIRIWIVLFLLSGAAIAQEQKDLTTQIYRIVQQEMDKQKIPALTVAVALGGRVVYSKGFGTADLENAVPATTETLIRTGSIAKPITAVAAMTLVEAGKLDLDAPIQKYCPAFPQKPWTITTRELLTHTAGIRHYKEGEPDNTRHYPNMSDGFSIFAADPLLFEPGTKFNYSTYGYTVVGCVLEGASGEKYFDYVREHVLAPAGMTHTLLDNLFTIVPHRARGYQVKDGKVLNAGLMDSSYKIPGGGLVSTAEDLVRFGIALMDGKLLKPATLTTMWTPSGRPQMGTDKPAPYGMGFGVWTIDGEQHIAHTGGQQGTNTDMSLIPKRRLAVAVMANDENADSAKILRQILELYHVKN